MALDRLESLIREARARSGNQVYDENQGKPQSDFVAFANDAQDRIFNLIMLQRPTLFVKKGYISTVAGTATYDLPDDIFISHNILAVEYTPNGDPQLYRPLDFRTPRQEISVRGEPDSYFLMDNSLVLSPIPNTTYANAVRIKYQYNLPRLDIRRAKIASVSGGSSDQLVLTWEDAASEQALIDGDVESITIVDRNGALVTPTTGAISLVDGAADYDSATLTLQTSFGSSLAATVGSFVLFSGTENRTPAYTTTHSQLPSVCRRYLVEYMTARAQMGDSSPEQASTAGLLEALEREIIDSIAMLEEDVSKVPILDRQFLNYAEDWQ